MRTSLVLAALILTGCTSEGGVPRAEPSAGPTPVTLAAELERAARAAQESVEGLRVELTIEGSDGEALGTSAEVRTTPCRYRVQDVAGRTSVVAEDLVVEEGGEGGSAHQVLLAPTGGILSTVLLPDGLCGLPSLAGALTLQEASSRGGRITYSGTVDAEALEETYRERLERTPGQDPRALLGDLAPTLETVTGQVEQVELTVDEDGLVREVSIRAADLTETLTLDPVEAVTAVEVPQEYTPLGTEAP